MHQHLLNTEGVYEMRAMYAKAQVYPTSTNGDVMLIRSHIAYHCGQAAAEAIHNARSDAQGIVDGEDRQ